MLQRHQQCASPQQPVLIGCKLPTVNQHCIGCCGLARWHRIKVSFCNFGRPFVKRFVLSYWTVVCVSCLFVTLVYCGHTVGWIKMKLGMQVGLGPSHTVLDGDPAPPIFGPCLLWPKIKLMAGWIKMPLGTEVGLGPGDCVRWGVGDPVPPPLSKKRHSLSPIWPQ